MEDSSFGWLIHELVAPLTPAEFPGLKSLHAVDAAGVHPLLLAVGHERYMPFRPRVPEEILTIANHILGTGQTSLAKFLFIAAEDDDPALDTHDIPHFFDHFLTACGQRAPDIIAHSIARKTGQPFNLPKANLRLLKF